MSKVILKGARLSNNPNTGTIANAQGVNGLVNVTVNDKQFYQADALVMDGLTPIIKTTSIWADENGKFPLSVAEYNEYMKGETTEGEVVRFDDVKPYEIDGKTYTHVKLLVLKSESPVDVINAYAKRQARAVAAGTPIPQSPAGKQTKVGP
jgi:hypothetical protein